MASNGSDRSGFLTAGGVLSIIAGIFQINNVVAGATIFLAGYRMLKWELFPLLPSRVFNWWEFDYIPEAGPPILFFIIGLPILVFGVLAVVGGVSAIRRKRFGLSLAGAICALLSGLLGILAVIFVSVSKREFGAERKEDGI
jgi:uncharacterized membrane protein HdeD (DUF308 family)